MLDATGSPAFQSSDASPDPSSSMTSLISAEESK
jgi:hypothetical protein